MSSDLEVLLVTIGPGGLDERMIVEEMKEWGATNSPQMPQRDNYYLSCSYEEPHDPICCKRVNPSN